MRKLVSLAALAALALALAPAAAEPIPREGTLTPAESKVTWEGSRFVNASTPSPEFCAVPGACDEFGLHVALGAHYWQGNPGAVQVGIQWKDFTVAESESEYDTFDLYVYGPDGAMVASSVTPVQSSAGIAASAQVVDIADADDGDYRVVVVPSNVADRAYHGVAMVQSYAPPKPSGELLPNLTALQPTGFHVQLGTYSLSRFRTGLRSCYLEETLQDEGNPTRCLRFDAAHANVGDGPFLLDVDLSTAGPNEQGRIGGQVVQVVLQADGTEVTRAAGAYELHPNHGHIHYKGFATYELYAVDGAGNRAGLATASRKSDFCMIDVDDLWFGLPGNAPRTRHFPQCNLFDHERFFAGLQYRIFPPFVDLVQRQGIDRGWADVYTWDLPGQYIDISAVPNGVYDVVNRVNPAGLLRELPTTDDEAATRIRMTGDTITCIPEPYGCPPGTSTK